MTKTRNFDPIFNGNLGVKQGTALTKMPIGSLIAAQNMYLDKKGGKYMRGGYRPLFALPINDECRQLHEYLQMSGTQLIMAYANTVIYQWNGAAVTSVKTGCAVDTDWAFCNFKDRCLGVNGADSFDYNGTSFSKISLTNPSAHIGLAIHANPASTMDGHYSYMITFWDSARSAESEPYSPLTAVTGCVIDVGAAGVNDVTLGNFPAVAAGETATHYRVYRRWIENDAGVAQETEWTRIAELVYATYVGTTWVDASNPVGTVNVYYDTGAIDVGNTAPANSKIILEFNNRILMVSETDPTLMIYSRKNCSHAFPTANYHTFGNKDGYRIIRVEKNGNSIVVHKKNSVWIIDGDPASTNPRRLNGRGTCDRYASCADVDGNIYRLSPDGHYKLSPTEYDAEDLRDTFIGGDIADEEAAINWAATSYVRMFSIVKDAQTLIYTVFPNTPDVSSKVLAFDFMTGQWMPQYVNTDIYSVTKMRGSAGDQEVIFGDGYGKVWRWDVGIADGALGGPDDLNGTASSFGLNTLTDNSKVGPLAWTVNAFVGCVVELFSGSAGHQRRRIVSNTANTLTVAPNWTGTPSVGCDYAVAAIDHYADEYWNSEGNENRWKRMRWIVPYLRQLGDYDIDVSWRRDFLSGFEHTNPIQIAATSSVWGTMIWGTAIWGSSTSNLKRLRFSGKFHYYSIRYRSQYAAQPIYWDGHGAVFQVLHDRNK